MTHNYILMVAICILGGILAGVITGFLCYIYWKEKYSGYLMRVIFLREVMPIIEKEMILAIRRFSDKEANTQFRKMYERYTASNLNKSSNKDDDNKEEEVNNG